jgi:hypothetical protein
MITTDEDYIAGERMNPQHHFSSLSDGLEKEPVYRQAESWSQVLLQEKTHAHRSKIRERTRRGNGSVDFPADVE